MNNIKRGNYFRKKTMDYLRADGWKVAIAEQSSRIFVNGHVIFRKHDMFGADLVAMNGREILFVQVKSGKKQVAEGIKQLATHPFPPCVKRWVVWWPLRAREPEIVEAT